MAEKPGPATATSNLLYSRLPIFLVLAYIFVVALGYIQDPLALSPQLDARENLTLAHQISQDNLASEPMYRAMLYPWLLSKLPAPALWPQLAVIVGIILHVTAAFQIRHLSGYLWKSPSARMLSFCLYSLNPASIFYAMQVMDMTLAIVLFLCALQLLLGAKASSPGRLLAAGILAGLACLARPHFLPVSLLLFLVPLIRNWPCKPSRAASSSFVMIGLAIVLSIQGVANLSLSGEFRILPWQGAYNLWAANRPGANGLYYKQLVDVSGESYLNPARAESEYLYVVETAATPPYRIDQINSHWRDKAVQSFKDEPARWIKLGLFKAYAVLNNFEQYNNLTFSFHKSRILSLKINPLNWGMLFTTGCIGLYALWLRDRRESIAMILLFSGYMVSLIIYYASARFRLPLVPFLAILGGGILVDHQSLLLNSSRRFTTAALLVLATGITFSSIAGVQGKETYVQDHLLLANALAETGNDAEAAMHARTVLENYSIRREAQRTYMISYFNLKLTRSSQVETFGSWEEQRAWVPEEPAGEPLQDSILGVYLWKWGQKEKAVSIWEIQIQDDTEGTNLARACLDAIGKDNLDAASNTPLTLALSAILTE